MKLYLKIALVLSIPLIIVILLGKVVLAFTNGLGGWLNSSSQCSPLLCYFFNYTITWDGIGGSQVRPGQSVDFSLWVWHCNEANNNPCDSSNGGTLKAADWLLSNSGVLPSSFKSWTQGALFGTSENCGRWQNDLGARNVSGVIFGFVHNSGTSCGGPPPPGCGNGSCNGSETCSSCSSDCGACPTSPPNPVCGDGSCNGSETCNSCPGDCGVCPGSKFTVEALLQDSLGNNSRFTSASAKTIVKYDPIPRQCYQGIFSGCASSNSCMIGGILSIPIAFGGSPCGSANIGSYTTFWDRILNVGGANYKIISSNSRCNDAASGPCNSTCTAATCSQSENISGGSPYHSAIYKLDGCSLSLTPATDSFMAPQSHSFAANVTLESGFNLSQVNFSSSNTSIAITNPSTIANPPNPSSTNVTGVSPGTATITATATVTAGATTTTCNDTSTATINLGSWWQVKNGDVITNGNLISLVSQDNSNNNKYLIYKGSGDFPGVAYYGGGDTANNYDFDPSPTSKGLVSVKNWIVNTNYSGKVYDFSDIESLGPQVSCSSDPTSFCYNDITTDTIGNSDLTTGGTPDSKGYYWYKRTGDLLTNQAIALAARKVVLLVKAGSLTISYPISLNDGTGLLLAAAGVDSAGAKGDIVAFPTVKGVSGPELEGIFLADSYFQTGFTNLDATSQLHIRGVVIGNKGIIMQRGLDGNTNKSTPAELFEYAPDQVLLFPSQLNRKRIIQKEIVP